MKTQPSLGHAFFKRAATFTVFLCFFSIVSAFAQEQNWCTNTDLQLNYPGSTWSVSPMSNVTIYGSGSSIDVYFAAIGTYNVIQHVGTQNYTTIFHVFAPPSSISLTGGATICSGGSATLKATGADHYTWSPAVNMLNGNGAKVIVTPTKTTTYTATGYSASGNCPSPTKTVTVTVVTTAPTCVVPSAPTGTAGGTYAGSAMRNGTPVTVTGAQVTLLNGYLATDLVGFAFTSTGWKQIPVQVDEKKWIDAGTIYHTSNYLEAYSEYFYAVKDASGHITDATTAFYSLFSTSQYCDPNTWVGYDTDPTFDSDDELSFMARDAGVLATGTTLPTGVTSATGVQISVTDPLNPTGTPAYVYIFKRSGNLDPSAGVAYLHYFFQLTGGRDYKTQYGIGNTIYDQNHAVYGTSTVLNSVGPNFESSTIESPAYKIGFADRWLENYLQIKLSPSNQTNLLLRHRDKFTVTDCERTEDTFDEGEGAFIANISGSIRAIRSYMGANSGPLTQRDHIFYDQAEKVYTYLRVHDDIPGMIDYNVYNPAVGRMLYNNNNNNTGGVTDPTTGLQGTLIDGSPSYGGVNDAVTAGPLTWEMVNSLAGTVFRYYKPIVDFDVSLLGQTSYYEDFGSATNDECPVWNYTNNTSSIPQAFGASGYSVFQQGKYAFPDPHFLLPVTDPRWRYTPIGYGDAYNPNDHTFIYAPASFSSSTALFSKLSLLNVNVFFPPATSRSNASAIYASVNTDLVATPSAWPTTGGNAIKKPDALPGVNIYPNPSGGQVSIDATGADNDNISIVIYNAIGRQVYQTQGLSNIKKQIDLHPTSGIGQLYIAHITIGGKLYIKKILVNK